MTCAARPARLAETQPCLWQTAASCSTLPVHTKDCYRPASLLQDVISKILKSQGEKIPLSYVEAIEVEELTLGMVPPRFHFCHARYNPTKNLLQLEADMAFQSTGFQCVVSPVCLRNLDSGWLLRSAAG